MKIKEICQKTGLTDRTVRYYIEEGLISPFYTENYLGRKSFDFSPEDLERLNCIATLRAFGFTVEEIRGMSEPAESEQILQEVKRRTEESLEQDKRRYEALSAIDPASVTDMQGLAKRLSDADRVITNEVIKPNRKRWLIAFLKYCGAFIAVWLPIVSAIVIIALKLALINESKIQPLFIILTLLCFLPSSIAVMLFQSIDGVRKMLRTVLTLMCVICIPLSMLCSFNSVVLCKHSYSVYKTSIEPNCQREGELLLKCSDCGRYTSQTLDKLPHTERVLGGVPPTCDTKGYSDGKYCDVCKKVTQPRGIVREKGHNYTKYVHAATCNTSGYTLYYCNTCTYSLISNHTHPTNEHDFQRDAFTGNYNCTKCRLEVIAYGNLGNTSTGYGKYYITADTTPMGTPMTLVIYGKGDMPDFTEDSSPPWLNEVRQGKVKEIVIEHGVFSIGENAFVNYEPNDYKHVNRIVIRSKHIWVDHFNKNISGVARIFYE